jgi:DNA repair protein RecO (recombination protein O)
MLCVDCRLPGSANPAPETVALLAALLSGAWPQAEAVGDRPRREASSLVATYLQWHLERGLRSLDYVDR